MRSIWSLMVSHCGESAKRAFYAAVLLCLTLAAAHAAVTPTGTEITNTATAFYSVNNIDFSRSDSATLTTQEVNPGPVAPTAAEITLTHLDANGSPITLNGTEYGDGQGNFTPVTGFTDLDGTINTFPVTVPTSEDEFGYRAGEPVVIIVSEGDKNINPVRPDTIVVTISTPDGSDTETLTLIETGDNTGIFAGVLPTQDVGSGATPYDGILSVKTGTELTATYTDVNDPTDTVDAATVFNPVSRIFDSSNGAPINGVSVTLIDAATGLPADGKVFDEDGETPYPVTVVSGPADGITASAVAPTFGPGEFSFPVIADGEYYLQLVGPETFRIPSDLDDDTLRNTPNGPFDVSGISRGESFIINNRVFRTDIGADPLDNSLLISKQAGKTEAGIGDSIRFTITLVNNEVKATDARIIDNLPAGLRYMKGSARLDREKVDLDISKDGRELSLLIDEIAPFDRMTLTYIAQVTALARGEVTNNVRLSDDIVTANSAKASVIIRDEFFKDTARLFGRIYLDDCEGNQASVDGVPNIRLFMEDGTYVVSDEQGEWHIEDVKPGTHVVQMDKATIPPYMELMECPTRGFHAGRNFSQFVDVQGGSFWRVDFFLKMREPEIGEIRQQLDHLLIPLDAEEQATPPFNSPVDQKVGYKLTIDGNGLPLQNVMGMISLPEGFVYETGSSKIDGRRVADPEVSYGTLIYRLQDKPDEWKNLIEFNAYISDRAPMGNLVTRAITRFQSDGQSPQQIQPVTTTIKLILPPKEENVKPVIPPKFANFSDILTDDDKTNLTNVVEALDGLGNLKLEVIGHTDSSRISSRVQHIFANNQVLSEARSESVAAYLAEELGIDPSSILSSGRGPSEPVASNNTREGRALNRRVEVKVLNADAVVDLASAGSDVQLARIQAMIPGLSGLMATAAGNPARLPSEMSIPEYDEAWFQTAPDEPQWLWPPLDRSPSISSTKIAISHSKSERATLTLNGSPVSALNFDGNTSSRTRNLVVSQWRGVDLMSGPNHFEVTVMDTAGRVVSRFNKTVHFSEAPAHAELVENESTLLADGINSPIIAVRLTDKDGFPIRANVQGKVDILEPYTLYSEQREQEINPLTDMQRPHYQVGQDGVAQIRLSPTFRSGEVVLRFNHGSGQTDEIRAWLKPKERDWILVALGDLAVGYNANGGDSASMKAAGVDDNIYHDGRLAFFAQGQVMGDWLVTAAYDSGKENAEPFARLLEPDRYYTLYGDASQQQLDASSGRKLYVRVERERFYTVFGDIDTNLTVTELGRYSRKLTGIQSVYQGETFEASGFISQTNQGFVREEIQGDGTSGLYRLSNQQLVLNSESLTLIVRSRYRSENILTTTNLTRDIDYVIDYSDGTIYFKGPIASTDDAFNPQYIVAEYEVDNGDNLGYIAGGRAGVKLLDNKVRAGVTSISQNQSGDDRHLRAVDAKVQLGDTEIRAELAQSEEVISGNGDTANAHLIEVSHRDEHFDAKAYVRQQEDNFGLDQTSSSENDFSKEGIEGNWYINDDNRIQLITFHHQGLTTGYDSYQGQTDWIHRLNDNQQVSVGVITAQQENLDDTLYSDQVSLGYSQRLMNNRLTLGSQLLGNISERSDAYDRLLLGADYRLTKNYGLFAEHETGFESEAPERSVFGVRATPWAGGRAEQSIEQVEVDDNYRLFAVSGLSQDYMLNEQWSLSAGFEQTQDLENSAPEEEGTTENFHATYAGSAYRTEQWQWNNRIEYRNGSSLDKWVARTNVYHPLTDALATGGSIDWFHESASDYYANQFDARFDLALRPRENPYALLWQTRWVQDSIGGNGAPDRTRKFINNAHLNWMISDRDQLAGQYGIKRVLDQYDGDNYASTTDFMAAEWRHHLTDRWDVGAHGRRLHGYEAGQVNHGLGVSVGFIPATNTWVSVGYNFSGFIDSDFSAANFTAQGVYLKLRFKADQDSLAALRAAFR